MLEAVESPYLVSFSGNFEIGQARTKPPEGAPDKDDLKDGLEDIVEDLYELQRVLYADDRYSILLVFQAMDAAGKDSTIRKVMSGVNPAGCQVHSFKAPSHLELDHDFLWRTAKRLPQRGRIGIFNRSYYEEVLVVRVHPEFLESQKLPEFDLEHIWEQRFDSIRDHEKHLARNGTVILKFFLNVSKQEQKNRFLRRIDRPDKNWKFNEQDVAERERWNDYMAAYQDALNATSRPWAPWYAIPADSKPYMRWRVAGIIRDTLESLDLRYPSVSDAERARFQKMREVLEKE